MDPHLLLPLSTLTFKQEWNITTSDSPSKRLGKDRHAYAGECPLERGAAGVMYVFCTTYSSSLGT